MYIVGRGEVIGGVHCGEMGGYRGVYIVGRGEVIGGCTLWGDGRL